MSIVDNIIITLGFVLIRLSKETELIDYEYIHIYVYVLVYLYVYDVYDLLQVGVSVV